jgi:thiamine-phosphate pyrophosphorylase
MTLPRLYPITDRKLSQLSHAEQVERMAQGGATLIQLREKHLSPREFYEEALAAMKVARALKVKLIINDRVDIAIAVDADGVHLGQDDLPPKQARNLLGQERIIGYSTHDIRQALAADSMPIDYIAIGPIFTTTTKANPEPVVGLEMVKELRAHITKPIVAIGGITLARAAEVFVSGVDSFAVISDLFSSGDLTARVQEYFKVE